MACSLLSIVASSDDVLEGVLKRGTTDKEAIDVGSLNEVGSVLLGHGAAVQNASFVSRLGRNVGA